MSVIIKVENLSKVYQLGQIGTGTISRDLERWYARIRKKEDPYLKIGETNDQTVKSKSNIVWSLKNINFEIEQGDTVGIIGRNGAGKSTLLKILSKVTAPTTGKISGKGRIASLLEVGTGFHPELSGRENIFLNGAILGMRKKEILRKLDEIVDFAGVERYLDTPVKRYSSGMYVRLAFAVAAHLESEILIVDEVLAVGDAEFQKKCLGKMGEVSKGEGRTVLFVSHNMASIKQLCKNAISLENGEVSMYDKTSNCIESYLRKTVIESCRTFKKNISLNAFVNQVTIKNNVGNASSRISIFSMWSVEIEFEVTAPCNNLICAIGLTTNGISAKTIWHEPQKLAAGKYLAIFEENETNYGTGIYNINIGLSLGEINLQYIEDAISFEIVENPDQFFPNILRTQNDFGIVIDRLKSKIIPL